MRGGIKEENTLCIGLCLCRLSFASKKNPKSQQGNLKSAEMTSSLCFILGSRGDDVEGEKELGILPVIVWRYVYGVI